jgi:hypothetical protein
MRIILVALMIALFAAPAHARGKRGSGAQHQSSGDQQKKSLAEEKAYKDALSKIPNQKPVDPWGKVR